MAIALGTGVVLAGSGDAHRERPRSGLLEATLSQTGRSLVFTIRTTAAVPLAKLDRLPRPRRRGSRYLCLGLRPVGHRGERRLCLGGKRASHRWIGIELANATGKTIAGRPLAARVRRRSAHELVLSLIPSRAGLRPHRYRWWVVSRQGRCRKRRAGCGERLPPRGSRAFRLRAVRAVGCTGGTPGLVHSGARERRIVALTFDDGPGPYTPRFLSVLREKHVHGTFFEIGQEVAGRAGTMRKILRQGHEIGNHTMHHGLLPSYWDLAATNATIRAATHFQPCLFRPPGGEVNASVVAAAGEAGMKTILWDVDPGDWANPGGRAVFTRVVGAAQPGSIVVMHDGGGSRAGTLAALPAIIHTLRGRGYRFATVSELLGQRIVYRPYG